MSQGSEKHYLIVTYAAWAHIRSLIGLSNTLLNLNPDLHLTLLIPSNRASAASLEWEQYRVNADSSPDDRERRVRIIHYGSEIQGDGSDSAEKTGMWSPLEGGGFIQQAMKSLGALTDDISELKPIHDPITGKSVTPHQLPLDLIITDITLSPWSGGLKQKIAALKSGTDGKVPPLLGFAPYSCSFLDLLLHPREGGYLSRAKRIITEAGDDQEKFDQMKIELIQNNSDIINIPGLWPLHFYEADPVSKDSNIRLMPRLVALGDVFRATLNGVIVGWPHCLGKGSEASVAEMYGKAYLVGPQLPPVVKEEWTVEGHPGECKAYLDASPPRSVVYISFGTALFAPKLEQLKLLLDVLSSLGRRYIISRGRCDPETEQMLRETVGKVKDPGLYLTWAPQRAVLTHRATGVFVTHGGSNSAMEAMMFQVPMVQWPSGFDQPCIANEMDKLGVAKELMQIRDGYNVGKPTGRDGNIIQGTEEALRAEFISLFSDLETDEWDTVRSRLGQVSRMLQEDREIGGTHQNLQALADFKSH